MPQLGESNIKLKYIYQSPLLERSPTVKLHALPRVETLNRGVEYFIVLDR